MQIESNLARTPRVKRWLRKPLCKRRGYIEYFLSYRTTFKRPAFIYYLAGFVIFVKYIVNPMVPVESSLKYFRFAKIHLRLKFSLVCWINKWINGNYCYCFIKKIELLGKLQYNINFLSITGINWVRWQLNLPVHRIEFNCHDTQLIPVIKLQSFSGDSIPWWLRTWTLETNPLQLNLIWKIKRKLNLSTVVLALFLLYLL